MKITKNSEVIAANCDCILLLHLTCATGKYTPLSNKQQRESEPEVITRVF